MASFMKYCTAIVSLFLLLTQSSSAVLGPKAIVLKVAKDPLTGQHTAVVQQRTPLVAVKLSIDLGGDSMWMDCENDYNSSSYRSINCSETPRCSVMRPLGCSKESCFDKGEPWFCSYTACVTGIFNPFNETWDDSYFPLHNWYDGGEAAADVLSLQYTTCQVALVSQFLFNCAPTWVSRGFAAGVIGVAGLGPTAGALPTQLAQTFGLARNFKLCLTSSRQSTGSVIFGGFPVSKSTPVILTTPLLKNPASNNFFVVRLYSEYYINVISIKVNAKTVPVDTTLLTFYNGNGDGGTKISTADPYTVLRSSIYKALVAAILGEIPPVVNSHRISSPAGSPPFEVCFSGGVPVTWPLLPSLSLVLEDGTEWKFSGRNLFVEVAEGVMCLGFVEDRRLVQDQEGASVVIGAQQIEDHLLEFDLPTYSLSVRKTSCAKFSSKATKKA